MQTQWLQDIAADDKKLANYGRAVSRLSRLAVIASVALAFAEGLRRFL